MRTPLCLLLQMVALLVSISTCSFASGATIPNRGSKSSCWPTSNQPPFRLPPAVTENCEGFPTAPQASPSPLHLAMFPELFARKEPDPLTASLLTATYKRIGSDDEIIQAMSSPLHQLSMYFFYLALLVSLVRCGSLGKFTPKKDEVDVVKS